MIYLWCSNGGANTTMHAVAVDDKATFKDIAKAKSVCQATASHGWDVSPDFVKEAMKCHMCAAMVRRLRGDK